MVVRYCKLINISMHSGSVTTHNAVRSAVDLGALSLEILSIPGVRAGEHRADWFDNATLLHCAHGRTGKHGSEQEIITR